MTEQEIPQDMNFTAGCLDGLMLLCLILTCMRIARSFGVEGEKKRATRQIMILRNCGICHHSG